MQSTRSVPTSASRTDAIDKPPYPWRMEGIFVLSLFLFAALCVGVAYQRGTQATLDLGTPTDGAYIEGFFAAERSSFSFSFRWSTDHAQIRFPGIGRDRPLRLSLKVIGWLDSAGRPMTMTVAVDHQPLGAIAIGPMPPERVQPYEYFLLIPPAAVPSGDLVVELTSATFSPPGEARQLGLAVNQASLLYGKGWRLPPPWPTLAFLATILLTYAVVRLATWGRWVALSLACGLALALAILLVTARIWITPHLPAFAGAMAVIVLFLGLARLLAGRNGVPLPRAFAILSLFAPLFLWWQRLLIHTPGGGIDYLPASFPLICGATYLGAAWQRRRNPDLQNRWATGGAALIVAFSLVYAVVLFARVFGKDYANDFHALFDGVRRFFLSGQPLYDLEAIQRNPFGDSYKYPPFFSLVLWPLARTSFVPALQIWRVANLFLMAVSAWLLAKSYRFGRNLWLWAGLLLILLNLRSLSDTISYGQVDVLLFLLIVGTLITLQRGHGWQAGFLLALATMLKLYPAFLALFFVLRREWRALAAFVLGLILLAGLSIAVLGLPVHITYLRDILPISGGGTAWVENQTLNGFLNRLTTDQIALTPITSRRADLAALVGGGILTLVSGWLVYRFGSRNTQGYDLGFALLLVTMLLSLPAAWLHYETILVLPLVLFLVRARDWGTIPFRALAPAGLALGLLTFGNVWSVFQREVYGRFWQLLLSYKMYGMAFLWLALALLLWFSRNSPAAGALEKAGKAEPVEQVTRQK